MVASYIVLLLSSILCRERERQYCPKEYQNINILYEMTHQEISSAKWLTGFIGKSLSVSFSNPLILLPELQSLNKNILNSNASS